MSDMSASTDRVVAEMDVFSCRTLLSQQTQVALLQYPLRPPWRPYEIPDSTKIRVKPNAKRIEMEVPLDTKGENFNEDVEGAMQIEQLTLRSRATDLTTSYALGHIRDGKVYLMPIDEAAQLRPHMSHLDEPATKEPAQEAGGPAETELVALQVQVQRRETERQIQNKLNSYAHISKLEAEEDWVEVEMEGVQLAESFWDKMRESSKGDLDMSLSRKAYLQSLVPASDKSEDSLMLADPQAPTSPRPSAHLNGQPSSSKHKSSALSKPELQQAAVAVQLSNEERSSLESELTSFFRHGAIAALPRIRKWLLDAKKRPELDGISSSSDGELHSAITQLDIIQHIGSAYVYLPSDNANLRAFRKAVLNILSSQASVKKADVIEAVRKADIDMSEAQCMRAIKEICKSQGTSWQLAA